MSIVRISTLLTMLSSFALIVACSKPSNSPRDDRLSNVADASALSPFQQAMLRAAERSRNPSVQPRLRNDYTPPLGIRGGIPNFGGPAYPYGAAADNPATQEAPRQHEIEPEDLPDADMVIDPRRVFRSEHACRAVVGLIYDVHPGRIYANSTRPYTHVLVPLNTGGTLQILCNVKEGELDIAIAMNNPTRWSDWLEKGPFGFVIHNKKMIVGFPIMTEDDEIRIKSYVYNPDDFIAIR